jgi:hypothetical protein
LHAGLKLTGVFVRLSFQIIWEDFQFRRAIAFQFGFYLLARYLRMAESETVTAAMFGGNQ